MPPETPQTPDFDQFMEYVRRRQQAFRSQLLMSTIVILLLTTVLNLFTIVARLLPRWHH
jgi:hypothetical protein